MIFERLLIGAAFLIAAVAFVRARRTARRLERLTESYWELRYEHGQLRARVSRLEPPVSDPDAAAASRTAGATAFVPLSSLTKR